MSEFVPFKTQETGNNPQSSMNPFQTTLLYSTYTKRPSMVRKELGDKCGDDICILLLLAGALLGGKRQ